jgi:hypothetical protein
MIRWMIFVFVVLAMAPVTWKSGGLAWHQMQLLYWQRQAMTYAAPADQTVMDITPTRDTPYSSGVSCSSNVAPPWVRFNQMMWPSGRNSLAMLFLHERKNGRGESRLIAIEAQVSAFQAKLIPVVIRPGSVFESPQEVLDSGMHTVDYTPGDSAHPKRVLFFGGQADANDPSHFTIDFAADGHSYTIDGWLRNDDRIDFLTRPKKAPVR